MKKHRIAAIVTACAVFFPYILFPAPDSNAYAASIEPETNRSNSEPENGTFVTRTLTSEADGLRHFSFKDQNGKTISLKNGTLRKSSKKKSVSLPVSYNSVDAGKATSIKDQGVTGACWSFGAMKALESSAIIKSLSALDDTDFSENHLAWYSYRGETDSSHPLYNDTNLELDSAEDVYSQGGDALMAASTLANWWGIANEEDAPFTASTNAEVKSMIQTMKNADESLRSTSRFYLQEANCYDNTDDMLSKVKQAVMEHGDVNVSHYYSDSLLYRKNENYSVYQTRYGTEYANHSVSIVGWDDNFSSFRNTPPASGAWLIANSWGEDTNNKGYYWVSYFDSSLTEYYTFELESTEGYDTNYQYDGAGYCGALSYDTNTAFANVFTNSGEKPQEIKAAGTYTITDNQEYTVYVYRNVQDVNPDSGEYVASATTNGVITYNGYHTISLKEPVTIAPGETFAIVIQYNAANDNVYIPLEGDIDSTKAYYNGKLVAYKTFGSKAGQSFIYNAAKGWTDTTSVSNASSLRKYSAANYNNVCLKAFASTISEEDYLSAQKDYTSYTVPLSNLIDGTCSLEEEPEASALTETIPSAKPSVTQAPAGSYDDRISNLPVETTDTPQSGYVVPSDAPVIVKPDADITSPPLSAPTAQTVSNTAMPETTSASGIGTPDMPGQTMPTAAAAATMPTAVSAATMPTAVSAAAMPTAATTPAQPARTASSGQPAANTPSDTDDSQSSASPSALKTNRCKKVKAAQKKYTIKKKNKTTKAVFVITSVNRTQKTTDKISVKIKNKKIAKVTYKTFSAKKLVLTVKGLKKGKTVLTVKIGSQSAKTAIQVK